MEHITVPAFAESVGVEPTEWFPTHGLAIRSITALATFLVEHTYPTPTHRFLWDRVGIGSAQYSQVGCLHFTLCATCLGFHAYHAGAGTCVQLIMH